MRLRTVIPVWSAAVAGAVLIGVLAPPSDYLEWLPLLMGSLVLLTFVLQLVLVQKDGLVDRMMASLGGAIVILAVATLALTLLSHGRG